MQAVILTGISRGLGKAFFDILLTTSIKLIAIGRSFPPMGSSLLRSHVSLFKQDLSSALPFDTAKLEHLVDPAINELIFINNAATIEPIDRVGEFIPTEILPIVSVNLIAPIFLTNFLVQITKKRNIKLRILHISTGAATTPIQGWSLYCSTKAAIKMFYDCLSKENTAISIKQINPGVLDTKMQQSIRDWLAKKSPSTNWYKKEELSLPEEAARSILFNEGLL